MATNGGVLVSSHHGTGPASSSPASGRPASVETAGGLDPTVVDMLHGNCGAAEVTTVDGSPALAIAVSAGRRRLGALFVEQPAPPATDALLASVQIAFSIVTARRDAEAAVKADSASALMHEIRYGSLRDPEALERAGQQFGVRLDLPHAGVVLTYEGPAATAWSSAVKWIETPTYVDGDTAWTVVTGDVRTEVERLCSRLQGIVAKGRVLGAAGGPVSSAADTWRSFREAESALDLWQRRGGGRTVLLEDLGLAGLLLGTEPDRLRDFARAQLGPLLEEPGLLETLAAWLEYNGSPRCGRRSPLPPPQHRGIPREARLRSARDGARGREVLARAARRDRGARGARRRGLAVVRAPDMSGAAPATGDAELIITGGDVVTMNARREVMIGGAIAVGGGVIIDVGDERRLRSAHPGAAVHDATRCVVTPGMVDAHQHLTGDPLVRSCIPDLLAPGRSIFEWSVPCHAAHGPDDDETSAMLTSLSLLLAGVTTVVEAGTVAHPERVAAGMDRAGIRGTVGRWGWDEDGLPFAAPVDESLRLQRELLERWPRSTSRSPRRIEGWVTLVGHSLISDELFVGASQLARELGTGLTFHMSPTSSDPDIYVERHGKRPLQHLADLGVLGPHVLLGHGVWLDDSEVALVLEHDVAIAYCPWAYLRLGQGTTIAGRHAEIIEAGGRVALGCDACNAADHHDILSTAALAAGLARDTRVLPTAFGAHQAFELATIAGAAAIGMADRIGSIEVGKAADLVVFDASGIEWNPRGDVALQLVWGQAAATVRDVYVDGHQVIASRRSTRIDHDELIARAAEQQTTLLARAGITVPHPWPYVTPT